jgi:hypothetical protein
VSTNLEELRVARKSALAGIEVPIEDVETVSTPWFATDWARFALVAAELGLLVLIIRLFGLEGVSFGNLAVLAWAGFLVHHLLTSRLRMPFFVILSLASLVVIAPLKVAGCVAAGAFVLIAVCHLPIRMPLRIGLVALLGALAAYLRASWVTSPVNLMVWTILASMFMFRIIVYLYDVGHKTAPASVLRACAYFLMLPNAFFPLYPVVDYKTFCATYFNGEPLRIYQTGLRWIVRGVVQLLLYRIVYQLGLVDPLSVTSLGGVARFMVATYLLYLQVSGRFHLIVGMLHLFGFNLPETNHRYLLAASFTDFWRRINIYWKDFIMKIFFYPAYFRVKRLGTTAALACSTLFAFFVTWALHLYQAFWLRGSVVFSWQDILFWSILAALVTCSVLYEAKWGRRRSLARSRPTAWSKVGLALRTVGLFVTICVLWTIWTCDSADELAWLASAARHATATECAVILAGLFGLGAAAIVLGGSAAERTESTNGADTMQPGPSFIRSVASVGLQCGLLLVLAVLPRVLDVGSSLAGQMVNAVQEDKLNRMDLEGLRRGYYEELDVPRRQVELQRLQDATPADWNEGYFQALRRTGDFRYEEAVPSARAFFRGQWVTHNRWGMRNRECEKVKAPGVVRLALLGSSHDYGFGIKDDETYAAILEELLNREAGGDAARYEVLNFALPGHATFQYLFHLEHQVVDFDPDVVLLAINAWELRRAEEHLSREIMWGHELPYAFLGEAARRAGVHPGMPEAVIRAKLRPYMPELVKEGYERFGAECRRRGISVFLVFRPFPHKWANWDVLEQEENKRLLVRLAEETSLPMFDLSGAFDGVKYRTDLILAPWDDHTNAKGQRYIADALFRAVHDREGKCLLLPRGATSAR